MKLKNVKVGQRVKIKKRVGLEDYTTFTLEDGSERFDAVVAQVDLEDSHYNVGVKLNTGRVTFGKAEDLKLIEDVQ